LCARRATQKLCAGGSAPAPWVPFFARAKKGTKESTPQPLRRPNNGRSPARLASAGRSPNSPGANYAPRARSKVSRQPPALLGARLATTGRLATQLKPWRGDVFRFGKRITADIRHEGFSGPRSRRRASQRDRELLSEHLFEQRRVVGALRVARRPVAREAQGVFAGSGVSFSLVTFSWTNKRKSPAVGQPPTSKRRRSRHKTYCRGGATRN